MAAGMQQSNGHRGTDAIVVGAGHNGLTAACYLARAGLDVLVLEASEIVGGMTATTAAIPAAPRHLINEGSLDVSLFNASTIVQDLDLHRFGLRQIEVDPTGAFFGPEGESVCMFRSVERTVADIRRFSRRDAETYRDIVVVGDKLLDVLLPFMRSHPLRLTPEVVRAALGLGRHPRAIKDVVNLVALSQAEWLERFENPMVAGLALGPGPMPSMRADFSAYMFIYLALAHRLGMHRFQGGTAALPWALQRCLVAHGGRVQTSARVDELLIDGGAVRGVRLDSGEEITARTVISTCSPKTTLNDLLPEGVLSDEMAVRARHIPTAGHPCFKVNVAFSGRLELPRHQAARPDDADLRLPVAFWHTPDQLHAAEASLRRGEVPETFPTMAIVPTAADPTQAPDGQDTLWLFCFYPGPDGGAWKEHAANTILSELRPIYAGIDELEIGRTVQANEDIAQRFNAVDGNVLHVDVEIPRMGPLRPAAGFGGYSTPVAGLYLSGAGTHPSAGICGLPGRLAAAEVVRDLKGPLSGSRRVRTMAARARDIVHT